MKMAIRFATMIFSLCFYPEKRTVHKNSSNDSMSYFRMIEAAEILHHVVVYIQRQGIFMYGLSFVLKSQMKTKNKYLSFH